MFIGLSTNVCLAFGAGILVGGGVSYMAASRYYTQNKSKKVSSKVRQAEHMRELFANLNN
jgi:hypothetical protein